jgi:hypothetical protein
VKGVRKSCRSIFRQKEKLVLSDITDSFEEEANLREKSRLRGKKRMTKRKSSQKSVSLISLMCVSSHPKEALFNESVVHCCRRERQY